MGMLGWELLTNTAPATKQLNQTETEGAGGGEEKEKKKKKYSEETFMQAYISQKHFYKVPHLQQFANNTR